MCIRDSPRYSKSCTKFLNKIDRGRINGFTSITVLNELLHKLVLAEIADKQGLKLLDVINLIKKTPDILKDLEVYEIIERVETLDNLVIYNINTEHFIIARKFMKQYGLLSNDALHVAVMKTHGIENIASNDLDFERVRWVKLYKPSKI